MLIICKVGRSGAAAQLLTIQFSLFTQHLLQDLPEISEFSQKYRPTRRSRLKSVSEGVASMRTGLTGIKTSAEDAAVASAGAESKEVLPKQNENWPLQSGRCDMNGENAKPTDLLSSGRQERRQRHRRMKSRSEGVAFMRSNLSNEITTSSLASVKENEPTRLATLSELTQVSAKVC